MKKNITLSTIALISLLLVGCGGGGGGSSTSSSANTGTGYYVDSAVAGVDYICGTQKGKTDKDGKFTFEKGKECSFKLAGIPLRTTPASELQDGKKVLEDNPKVAKFLQSIDGDGDLSNGIQITDEVLDALTTALETLQVPNNTVPDGQNLTEVVAEVGDKVAEVSGEVPTDEEVQGHLTQTQTEITKELLAGKTFYVVGSDEGEVELFKFVVNNEATSINAYKLDGTPIEKNIAIQIVGNKLIFADNNDGSYTLISQEDGYIFGDDRFSDGSKDGIGHRLYTSQSDAQAYYDSLNDNTGSNDLTSLIVGKTYYTATHDSYTDGHGNLINNDHVEEVTFNADGHTVTDRWTQKNGETKTSTFNYSIENNSLNLNGVHEGDGESFNVTLNTPITQTDTYIQFANGGRFFKTYDAAEAAL